MRQFILRTDANAKALYAYLKANWRAMAANDTPFVAIIEEYKAKRHNQLKQERCMMDLEGIDLHAKEDGAISHSSDELDVEDGLMCVWFDDTEISHLLRAHMNDQDNLEVWQSDACTLGAETIDRLRAEVKRLRTRNEDLINTIKSVREVAINLYSATCGECESADIIIDMTSDV